MWRYYLKILIHLKSGQYFYPNIDLSVKDNVVKFNWKKLKFNICQSITFRPSNVRRGDYRFKVTEDLMVMSDGYMECGMDKNKQVFCQLEMLLVRTIIDNRELCDISCAGSREAYLNNQRPLPAVTCDNYRHPLPPVLPPPPPFLKMVYERYNGTSNSIY